MFDDLDQGPQVWEDGATHQDGDLLDDLDARVAGLKTKGYTLISLENGTILESLPKEMKFDPNLLIH